MTRSRRFVLARHAQGLPRLEDFKLEDVDLPAPGEGQVLVRNILISVDPGMRARLSATRSYAEPIAIGETIQGASVGEILESQHPRFQPGDIVATGLGWQEHAVCSAKAVRKVPPLGLPPSTAIGVLGIPGMTAYFGLYDVGGLKAGQTVVVSSAAGAVGSAAAQIAKIEGATVIGIAGGPEKCTWLTDGVRLDVVVDYKIEQDLTDTLQFIAPQGVDIFFDNVGNAMVDAVLPVMNPHGRIVISGQVADYNVAPEQRIGIRNTHHFITERLRMEGLVVFDYAARFPEAAIKMADWIKAGRLLYREDITEGFETLPEAFIGLFRGENFGRRLVRTGPDPEPR